MPNTGLSDDEARGAWDAYRDAVAEGGHNGAVTRASKAAGIPSGTFSNRLQTYEARNGVSRRDVEVTAKLESVGYQHADEMTPVEAWDRGAGAFERKVSKALKSRSHKIKRGDGPFCIFHQTDVHLDDDGAALKLIEDDIRWAKDMDAIMCHGGDALNNWPLAGRLARKWADQECTKSEALLRLEHYIGLFAPDVWVDGNHEEMNPYLDSIIKDKLPEGCFRDYWTARFTVETPKGRPFKVAMSHKFGKGSSWFHKSHGHIREMLEAEEADLYMDGHVHCDGLMYHTLPERGIHALFVASSGYKVVDDFAARISRGGKLPKIRGRAHWIVVDPKAEFDSDAALAFKDPEKAMNYLGSLQNMREV